MRYHYLLAGCIVMAGCFLTQTNIDYRAIFLLLMLAGLFELKNVSNTKPLRRTFFFAIWVLLFCLWSDFFRRGIDSLLDWIAPNRPDPSDWDLVANAFFIGRELAWWWLMSVAAAFVLHFVRTSPSGRAVIAKLPGARPATAPAA